ncbi:MAG: SIMPL domain-containing protein, partial [Chloroflexia bacterium]|nr:SIMPL domain-containing protein [Chloroflexia bacterium]
AAAGAAEEGLVIVQIGAAYDVADCAPLVRAARESAIADARAQAEVQAELLDVALGEVVASADGGSDLASGADPYGLASSAGTCQRPPSAVYPGVPVTLPGFDPTAPVEVEVYAAVNLTFAIESTEATPAA